MRRQPFFLTLGVLAASLVILAPATVQAAVTISSAATKNMVCASGVCSPNHKTAVLNITDLQNLLAASNVTVTTGSGSLAAQTLDIIVNAAVTWSSGSTLKLDAYQSVAINKPIAVTGVGGVTLTTNDGGTEGALAFGAKGNINFSNLSSSLTINGAAYTLVGNITTLASDIAVNPSGNFALANSYDAQGDGTYDSAPISTTFTGSFEGLGNDIDNLTVIETVEPDQYEVNVGLFGEIDAPGEVQYLGLTNVYVRVESGSGKIRNIQIGGLVGFNYGTLVGDFTTGMVRGNNSSSGGLVGDNYGMVSLSHSTAQVRCAGGYYCWAGGLAGYNAPNDTIERSYATGRVTRGISKWALGVGGLVGGNEGGLISNCYATGAVYGDGDLNWVGGLIGANSEPAGETISSLYSTGAVTGGSGAMIGGLLGDDQSPSPPDFVNSYWDTTTSGTTYGAGGGNEPGITGLTTSQLQSGLPTGFDPSIWGQSPSINGGLPYLLANPPQ